jgi:hypothetical protein
VVFLWPRYEEPADKTVPERCSTAGPCDGLRVLEHAGVQLLEPACLLQHIQCENEPLTALAIRLDGVREALVLLVRLTPKASWNGVADLHDRERVVRRQRVVHHVIDLFDRVVCDE